MIFSRPAPSVLILLLFFCISKESLSQDSVQPSQIIRIANSTVAPPRIDGKAGDLFWKEIEHIELTAYSVLQKENIPVKLKACRNADDIYLMVKFPSEKPAGKYRYWKWNKASEAYMPSGNSSEDTFCIFFTDNIPESVGSDLWIWRPSRNDPSGHADDFYCIRNSISCNQGKSTCEFRKDEGELPWFSRYFSGFAGEEIPRFYIRTPTLSAADVKASGKWEDGFWTIELSRKMSTSHPDDLDFSAAKDLRIFLSIGLPADLPSPGTATFRMEFPK